MRIAYLDESGLSGQPGPIAVAACIADAETWTEFDRRWNAALAVHGVGHLHMFEFAGTRAQFKGWEENRRRRFIKACLMSLADLEIVIAGHILENSDYQNLPHHQRDELVDPVFCCLQECLGAIDIYGYTDLSSRTDVVYSQQDEFAPKMRQLYSYLQRKTRKALRLGAMSFANMRTSPGLQLADLAAYEIRHFYHLKATRPDLPVRYPLRMLAEHQRRIGVTLIKYTPGWKLRIQALGLWAAFQDAMWAKSEWWGDMLSEQIPDFVIGKSDLQRIAMRSPPGLKERQLKAFRQ